MSRTRAEILINKMLNNNLTASELEEFLKGFDNGQQEQIYSEILEAYFDRLLKQMEQDKTIKK